MMYNSKWFSVIIVLLAFESQRSFWVHGTVGTKKIISF